MFAPLGIATPSPAFGVCFSTSPRPGGRQPEPLPDGACPWSHPPLAQHPCDIGEFRIQHLHLLPVHNPHRPGQWGGCPRQHDGHLPVSVILDEVGDLPLPVCGDQKRGFEPVTPADLGKARRKTFQNAVKLHMIERAALDPSAEPPA